MSRLFFFWQLCFAHVAVVYEVAVDEVAVDTRGMTLPLYSRLLCIPAL